MKVLIDENLDVRLHRYFTKHEAVTVSFMKWSGKANGDLILAMLAAGIEVLVTLDKNLQYQQSFKKYPVVVIVLHVAKPGYLNLKPLVTEIETLLDKNPEHGVYIVEQK